ncbi:membrane metallo-endopeptidase-like 1 isoform X2 [Acanthaster planci]|nr:membrane metallo-endopeptidase-like 1 isoform X2 [Acanthaster planci]
MDQSKNPCDNFFEYACGGWIKSHVIPEDETSYSVLIKIRDSVIDKLKALFEGSPTTGEPDPYHVVRNYYKSCEDMDTINELGAEPLTDLLTSLGGWPVLGDNPAGGNWDPAAFDFEKLWADIRGKYDVQMFVATEVSPVRNKPKYTLTAQIPDFGVPYDEIEEKKRPGIKTLFKESHDTRYRGAEILLEEKYSKMKEAYRQYAIDIALALGASEAVATQDINDLIEFETTLANFTALSYFSPEETTLGGIGMNVTDWVRLYQLMLPESVQQVVTEDEPIVVYWPDYMSDVTAWLKDQDNRTKANYMIWRLVVRMVPFMDETFLAMRRRYFEGLNHTVTTMARWKMCVSNVDNQYKFISGRMYVDEHFPDDTKQNVLNMSRNLQKTFKSMLNTHDWMPEEERKACVKKTGKMAIEIGYPGWIKNNTKFEAEYANVTAKEGEYFQNALRYREWNSRHELAHYGDDLSDTLWSSFGPTVVNAFYNSWLNGMVFPAGILQPPFYHKDLPGYSNYGSIGYIIGHEITHGFDTHGLIDTRIGGEGPGSASISRESLDILRQKAKCIAEQYSDFVMEENNRNLNGEQTLNENIADNGGLREAYKAYMDNFPHQPSLPRILFTEEQMFFLSFSQTSCGLFTPEGADEYIEDDVHSPGRFRVIGTLQNTEAFHAAFNCPAGSYMNPNEKCRVW